MMTPEMNFACFGLAWFNGGLFSVGGIYGLDARSKTELLKDANPEGEWEVTLKSNARDKQA